MSTTCRTTESRHQAIRCPIMLPESLSGTSSHRSVILYQVRLLNLKDRYVFSIEKFYYYLLIDIVENTFFGGSVCRTATPTPASIPPFRTFGFSGIADSRISSDLLTSPVSRPNSFSKFNKCLFFEKFSNSFSLLQVQVPPSQPHLPFIFITTATNDHLPIHHEHRLSSHHIHSRHHLHRMSRRTRVVAVMALRNLDNPMTTRPFVE